MIALYKGLLGVAAREAVRYRVGIALFMISSLYPFLTMAVWLAVSRHANPAGFRPRDFVAYYLAATVVNQISTVWVAGAWEDEIRTGSLSARLTRPADPVHLMFCRELCRRSLAGLVGLTALAVVWLLVPSIPRVDAPINGLLTVVALLLALVLNFLMACAFGMLTFWLTQIGRVYLVWSGIGFFLSGWVAPLALLPGAVRTIAEWSPFSFVLAFPVGLLTGALPLGEALTRLPLGIGWAVFFWLVYRLLWRAGLRRFDAVGA